MPSSIPQQSIPFTPTADGGHVSVLLHESVESLRPEANATYIDATFGGGGHTSLLLNWVPRVGQVIAIDADLAAQSRAESMFSEDLDTGRLKLVHSNFRDLKTVIPEQTQKPIAGVLFDLGVSSFQFDEGDRGFSFRFDAPLDMRFDQSKGITAADIVNGTPEIDLSRLIWTLGEEKLSRQIASAIATCRSTSRIETTGELASLIERTVGGRRGRHIHPATRTFQALRISVNGELEALQSALAAVPELLAPAGRLAVISFHSLEDRIVKRFIEAAGRDCVCPPMQPICTCNTMPTLRRVGKPIRADILETEKNPRSRSAILRVAERLDATGAVATWQGQSA